MIFDSLNNLYWREAWFLLLLALPILLLAFNFIRQQKQWHKLADEHLQPWLQANNKQSQAHRVIPFLALSWLFFVIALAGPRWVDWLPPEQQAEPASLMVIVDFSASMYAADAYPNRKAQAIAWLQQSIINKPKHLKIGIVLFAGHAFNLMPPTLDKKVITHFIAQLNDLTLPTLGNDLTAALSLAKQQFKNQDREQHMVILSDGDLSPPEQQRAHLNIKNHLKTIKLHFVGFGGNTPVKIAKQNEGFILHNGRAVQSRLQATWLKKVARLDNVSYQTITTVTQQSISQTLQLSTARLNQQAQQYVIWHELFPYLLMLAMLFFVISLRRINPKSSSQLLLSGFVISLVLSHSPSSQANEQLILERANKALTVQKYPLAQRLFSQIDIATAAFGEGIACYRQANFKCAARAFSKAAWQAKTDKIRAQAVFNLGNSYFFLGNYAQASVLFKDAKNLGFNANIAQKNLDFSNVMQQAVLQRIKDIKETFRRAKWRAAALGKPQPSLNDIVSAQNNLSLNNAKASQYFLIRQAINQQVMQQLGLQKGTNGTTQWIKTEQVSKQSTAQLLKRVLEMQLDIPAPLKEPQSIKGKRPW